jgi:tetratricopeptide (TPR) repeat protein
MNENSKNRRTKHPTRRHQFRLFLWFFGSLLFAVPRAAIAQDTVVHSTAADPAARIKKSGTILELTGSELRLQSTLGTEETIPAARVAEIHTQWTRTHEAGRAARSEGRLDDAIAALRQAKREETRPWAVRQIMADLAGCYLEAGRIDSAGDEFLGILASDPTTRHFDVIPIAWRGAAIGAPAEARAAVWLAARKTPYAALLGASWLLATRRTESTAVLDEISKSTDPRRAGLAAIQLWRTKLVTATMDDVRRWQGQLEKMPAEIQAAGWYLLGDCLSRLDQPEAASLAYLKIPVLFRQQRAMAADALLAAGKQLEKMSQAAQASNLYRELASDYPQLSATKEAQTRLEKLNAATR